MKITVRTLDDPPPPPFSWLVPGFIPLVSLVTCAAQPGAGKSILASTLATSVASGSPWLGLNIEQAGAVLFLSAEAAHSTERRLRALAGRHRGTLPISFAGFRGSLLDKATPGAMCTAIDEVAERFQASVRLLVVDALSSATRGADENLGKDMGRAMAALQSVVEQRQLAVLLLAHTAKGGDDRRARGHGGLLADVETHLSVAVSGRDRTLRVEKHRDAEGGPSIKFEIVSDGDVLDTVLISGRASGARRPARVTGDRAIALQALVELGGTATLDAWREEAVRGFGSRDRGAIRTAWSNARKALFEGGYVIENGGAVSVSNASATVS